VRAVLRYVEAAIERGDRDIYNKLWDCIEKPLLESALSDSRGNKVRMAAVLGINRNTIRKKMKRHGIT
jgi:DNA-binding protein Fis